MKVKVLLLLISFGLLVSFSLPAWSQEKQAEEDFTAYDLGEVVVTGENAAAVSKTAITNEITAEQIQATNSHTVAEALSHAPGVRVSTGRKNEAEVAIHGFNQNRILVLLDGVPYYEQKYRKLDLNQFPTENIAKIVVTKGASSVLYGANAMGGVINIITKKATTKPSASANLELGENGYNRESVSTGWQKGIFSYWLSYTHSELDEWRLSDDYKPATTTLVYPKNVKRYGELEDGGYRNNSFMKSDAVWAKFGIIPNKDSEWFVNSYYITREKGTPPNTIEERITGTSRPYFTQLNTVPKYDDWGIDLSGKQKIFDQLTLTGKVYYHNHVDDYYSYFPYDTGAPDNYDWTVDYKGDPAAKSRYKDFTLGGAFYADYQPVEWDILRFAYHYAGDSHKQRDDTYMPYDESTSRIGSVGLENEFNLIKNLSVVAGVSYDWFKVKKADRSFTYGGKDANGNTIPLDGHQSGDFAYQSQWEKGPKQDDWQPMGGLTYQVLPDTRIFTSVGRKGRYPTLSELFSSSSGNPDLKPETSVNTTVGVDHSFGKFAWGEVSYFFHDIKNWISRGPNSSDPYLNIGAITMQGFELNTEFYPSIKNLVLTFDYMYNNARDVTKGRVTNKVPYVPLHKFDAGFRYTVPRIGTRLDFNATYVAQTYNQVPTMSRPTDPQRSSDSQMTFDCRISQKFMKYFEAYMAMNNMLDRDYEPEYGYPAMGRTVWFGLTAKY